MTTFTDVVKAAENDLGVVMSEGMEPYRARMLAVVRMKKAIAKHRRSKLMTPENLMLAVEHCKRHKIEIRSPTGLVYYVEEALAAKPLDEQITDIDEAIAQAVEAENEVGDPDRWIRKLVRARGDARWDVYTEWAHVRREQCSRERHPSAGGAPAQAELFDLPARHDR